MKEATQDFAPGAGSTHGLALAREREPEDQPPEGRASSARRLLPPALIMGVFVFFSASVHLPMYGALGALASYWDDHVTPPPARPVEVTFRGPSEAPVAEEAPDDEAISEATDPETEVSETAPAPERERRRTREREEARATPPPAPEPEPEPEPEVVPAEVATVEMPPPPEEERRAVIQDSENPEVEAPDDARFLAEENNDVEEETVAEITSTVSDDAEPTTSSEEAAEASEAEGDADEELIAEMRDVEGSDARAVTPDEARERPPDARANPSESPTPTEGGATDESGADRTASSGRPSRSDEGGASAREGGLTRTREMLVSDGYGSYVVRVPDEGEGSGGGASGGARRDGPGSGDHGAGARAGRAGREGGGRERSGDRGGRSLGLSYSDFEAVYGEEELEREREARLEERRSHHRGRGRAVEWAAFRAAMENYIAEVRPGNQTALDAAASPFAVFINQMHVRIHRHFADGYIASLGPDAPEGQNDPALATTVEFAVNPDGTIYRVGIVRTSGNTMFDFGAFNSVYRSQPFPTPPDVILSADGRAWIRWTFERNPRHCGTWNAQPFILENATSPGTDPRIDTLPGAGGSGAGGESEEHGALDPHDPAPAVPERRRVLAPVPA
jgi:TonB family protein